jgi:hypothetical protein
MVYWTAYVSLKFNFNAMIKNITSFFALICACLNTTHAQTTAYGNFKLVDQEIIYQKVFEQDSITPAKLETYYTTLPYVSNLTTKADGVEFDVTDMTVDYKKFQFSQVATPAIIQTGKYSGKVSIGVKDGRYRVTVKSILLTGDNVYVKITTKEPLTTYSTKNNGTILHPDWCRPNQLGLLDKAFTDRLECKKTDDGDW